MSPLGISILKGFGFIQYAEEMSAENAIRGAQNIEILDHRMGIKREKDFFFSLSHHTFKLNNFSILVI